MVSNNIYLLVSAFMRQFFTLIILLSFYQLSFGQTDMPKELTPQALQKIKIEVDKASIKYKETISNDDITKEQIEFSVDTFKMEQIEAKSMEIDYSTAGMINDMSEKADAI